MTLNTRIEYLTLAVGNAKSHPVSMDSKHETAITFLTDLEDKLDVARVQLEIYHALLASGQDRGPEAGIVKELVTKLFTMSEVMVARSATSYELTPLDTAVYRIR